MSGVGALRSASGTGSAPCWLTASAGGQHGAVGRVRFRGGRQIRRRLRERDPALGVADEVVRVLGGDRDLQGARVGVADVLGGEDDHAPGHEERILAGLEHAHQPVDGGVGIARAHAFDERGDDVVVLLAALVVAERLLLQRLLDEGQVERLDARVAAPGSRRARARRARRGRRRASARRESGGRRRRGGGRARRVRARGRGARGRSACRWPRRRATRGRARACATSSGAMTSKEGFSVVAPRSTIVPFSTWGRKASCCALLKRWISSTKRMVARPCRR